MKYVKFFTLTLVALLFSATIAVTVSARFSERLNDENNVLSARLSDILGKIKNKLPFLAPVIDRIIGHRKPVEEEPQKPDDVNLVFDIEIAEKFSIKDPIPVVATLTNKGKRSIRVSELSLKLGTLDFYIVTAAGDKIHYKGPISKHPNSVLIKPEQTIRYELPDITIKGLFGKDFSSEEVSKDYFGETGEYIIRGVYHSFIDPSGIEQNQWEGKLKSTEYKFEIFE